MGQVFIGVAPAIGADDPDFLAPQLFAQRLERGYLVHHPGHALPAAGVGLVDQVRPVAGGAPMGGHPLADRIVSQVASLGVPADQRQGLGYRPVGGVVAAELQDLQQRDKPAPVVTGIGGPKRGLHRAPVHRPLGLELVNQLPQRLLPAGHSREYHLPHRVIGFGEGRFGDGEENVLPARHSLERIDQLGGDPPLSAGTNAVDCRNEQLHQRVGDLPLPLVHQRRQQSDGQRLSMTAQMRRRLDRSPGPPPIQHLRRHISEQPGWQAHRPYRLKLTDLGHHRFQADVSRAGFDQPENRVRTYSPVLGLSVAADFDQAQQPDRRGPV